jgi:hypothetical protein
MDRLLQRQQRTCPDHGHRTDLSPPQSHSAWSTTRQVAPRLLVHAQRDEVRDDHDALVAAGLPGLEGVWAPEVGGGPSTEGAVILPASFGVYAGAKDISEFVDFIAAKVLDVIGMRHTLSRRWRASSKSRTNPPTP